MPKPPVQLTVIPGHISGVELPLPDHRRLKARGKVNKRALKLEVLSDVQAAEAARAKLVEALRYQKHSGNNMPKRWVREALVLLGIPEDDQP